MRVGGSGESGQVWREEAGRGGKGGEETISQGQSTI